MREDGNFLDLRMFLQEPQHVLQTIPGEIRALAIIGIGQQLAARRPGEQHRHVWRAGVVRNLREPEDGLLEAGVVPVHKDHHAAVVALDALEKALLGRVRRDGLGLQRHEFLLGIAGDRGGPLDFACLPYGIWRDRNHEIGK